MHWRVICWKPFLPWKWQSLNSQLNTSVLLAPKLLLEDNWPMMTISSHPFHPSVHPHSLYHQNRPQIDPSCSPMNYDELRCTKIQSDVLIIEEWAISLIIMIFDVIKLLSYMHHSNTPTRGPLPKVPWISICFERQKDEKTERQKDWKAKRQKDLKIERRKDKKTERAGFGEQWGARGVGVGHQKLSTYCFRWSLI